MHFHVKLNSKNNFIRLFDLENFLFDVVFRVYFGIPG